MSEPTSDSTQSDGTTGESTTTTIDGVTIEKTVRRKDQETLRVEFAISTTLEHPIDLVVVEPIPAGITLDEIGFHSDYWNNWFVEENHLEHRIDLDPGTDHFTLYGVQADADTDPGRFLTEPTVDVTHKEGTATSTGQDTNVAATQRTTESRAEPVPQPAAPEAASDRASPHEESTTRTVEPSEPTESSILAELAADIEAADPDDESLGLLRDALDRPETESPTSIQVRLERVEGEVNELAAYTDALEEFLDEHGDGHSLLQSLEAEHDRFEARLETIDGRLAIVDEHATTLESLRTDLDAVESRLATLESCHKNTEERTRTNEQALEGVSRSVSDLQDHIERVETTVTAQTGDLHDNLEELEETVLGVQRWQQRFVDLVDVLSAPAAIDGDDAGTVDVPEEIGSGVERR